MRVGRLAAVGAFTLLSVAGCADSGGTPQADPGSGKGVPGACDGTFRWRVSEEWDIVVLDGPVTVDSGEELDFEGAPYRPWPARVTGGEGSLTDAEVLRSLSKEVDGPLEHAGENTAKLARKMNVEFNGGGQAQAVYYRGVRRVDADYVAHCAEREQAIRGKVTTWKSESNTTGLIDCTESLQNNPASGLAELVLEERCPSSSVAVKELAAKNARPD